MKPLRQQRAFSALFYGLILALIPVTAFSKDQILHYRIKDGDTVSQILTDLGICPLWRKNGSVSRTLRLNSLNENGAKKLPVGFTLALPADQLNIPAEEYAIREDEVERLISESRNYCHNGSSKRTSTLAAESTPKAATPAAEVASLPAAPSTARTPGDEERARSRLGAALDFDYFSINSTDLTSGESSTFLSRLSPGAHFYWKLEWNENFETIATIRYLRYSINQFDDLKTINNPDGSTLGFDFSARLHLNEKFTGSFTTGAQETLFNHSSDTTSVQIDTITIPFAGLGLDYRWIHYRGIDLNQEVYFNFLFSKNADLYQVNSGTNFGTKIRLSHAFNAKESKKIFLEGAYDKRTQNTSITNCSFETLSFGLGLEFLINED